MNPQELLEALPVKYYVINIEGKKIVQTNDSRIASGTYCYKELFDRDTPCEEHEKLCLCQQQLGNRDNAGFVAGKVRGKVKEFYRVQVKALDASRVIATYTNVTEEALVRKELKINTRRLERAEKLALFGYWEIDLKKKVMISTQGASDIYGINMNEMPLEEAQSIPLEKYRKPLNDELSGLIANEKNYDIVFEIERPSDGEIRSIHSIAEYRKDKKMVFGVIRDITEKVKAEKELSQTNTLLRTLIDNLPDAVYMKDVNYRKIAANKGDARNCGVENEEQLLGKNDFELFPKETAKKYVEDDRRVIENGETIINREEELPGVTKRWLLTSKIPLRNEKDKIIGLVGIGHDITHQKKMTQELKAAKEKAEESDRLKSLFLANMSHEIRTPLNAILGFSNMICSEDIEKEKLKYFGKIIENSGQRLTTVIDDIIDISLIQSNQLKINYSYFNIDELLHEMFVAYQTEKKKKQPGIKLEVKYCPNSKFAIVQSDKNRLYQVLKNLLDNAFKFTEKGFIEFGCSVVNNSEIELYVKDTGIGIEKDKTNFVFESFRQVEEGNTRKYDGSGLGLSIVSGIIDRLNGKISLDSEAGQGSTFYVTIPRKQEIEDESTVLIEAHQHKTLVTKQNENKIRQIVSFEDDPASIEYLKNVVHLQGCKLVNFIQASDGVEFIRNNHVDLVLMDVQLPDANGYEVTKMIKSEFPNLPVIIQTAYAMKSDMEKAYQAGCDDYLSKPVSLKKLKEIISHFAGNEN